MPDAALRELERRAATGDAHADAAWHRARSRSGTRSPLACTVDMCRGFGGWIKVISDDEEEEVSCDACSGTGLLPLDPDGFELAGYCGHAASREILGEDCSCMFARKKNLSLHCLDDDDSFSAWAHSLSRWGKATCIRAFVAAERVALARLTGLPENVNSIWLANSRPARARELTEAAEAWVLDQSEERLERCRDLCYGPDSLWTTAAWHVPYGSFVRMNDGSVRCAPAWHHALLDEHSSPTNMTVTVGALCGGEAATREAICAELVPWALGIRDLVAERREK